MSGKKDKKVDYRVTPPKVPKKNGRPLNLENMPLDSVLEVKQFLARMAQLVLRGTVETKIAYCVNSICNNILRASEVDLEQRVKALEENIRTEGEAK